MKKQLILDLIRYHVEGNNEEFRRTALEIVDGFRKSGDYDLAEFILALLSDVNTLTTQEAIPPYALSKLNFLTPVDTPRITLPLPNLISNDIDGIVHAVQRNIGVSRFLFEGKPGTGKTESAKLIARLLRRRLYEVSCSNLVDSRLGQTAKNIRALFDEIASVGATSFSIFLFDEIDSIALDRVNNNDIREMGRATSTIIKGLDQLPRDIVVIATTNLYEKFDKALSIFHSAFYQLFDEGIYEDHNYKVVVNKAIIVCTSNYKTIDEIKEHLGLPIYNRFDSIIKFDDLPDMAKEKIAEREIERLKKDYDIEDRELFDKIKEGAVTQSNAREIKHLIKETFSLVALKKICGETEI